MNHAVYFKVFDRDESKTVDKFAGSLMGEVLATVGNPLMNATDNPTPPPTLQSAFGFFLEFSLSFSQGFFISLEESLTLDLLSVGQGSKNGQTDINSDFFFAPLQRFGLSNFANEAGVPFACATPFDRACFGFAFQFSVKNDFDCAHLGQVQVTTAKFIPVLDLWKGHGVIATLPFESRKPRILTGLESTVERLKSQIDTNSNILQDLTIDVSQGRANSLEANKFSLLSIQTRGFFGLLMRCFADFKKVVVNPATFIQLMKQKFLLLFGWIQTVAKRFKHWR